MHYLITLTRQGGFTSEMCLKFEEWFEFSFSTCLVTRETHKSGHLHLHAVVESKVKSAHTLTKRIERLYEQFGVPIVKGISINVKTAKVLEGAIQYVMKDVESGSRPNVLKGWDMSTIEKQMLDNLKKMPRCLLNKDDRFLNQREATSLIIRYAKCMAVAILDKISFKQVVISMMKDGYQFDALKLAPIYVQILARSGYVHAAEDWIDGQLAFL